MIFIEGEMPTGQTLGLEVVPYRAKLADGGMTNDDDAETSGTNKVDVKLKNLVSQSGKWGKEDVEKWNLSLYINRMLEGGVTGKKQEPFLEYPTGMPKKNRYVVLTDAGRNYLESLTRV